MDRCVWPLAERAARLMAIDEVRIDIFLVQGRPDDCQINEISVSSVGATASLRTGCSLRQPHAQIRWRSCGCKVLREVVAGLA